MHNIRTKIILLSGLAMLLTVSIRTEAEKANLSVGLSHDSNVYRTPAENYVDYAADPNGSVTIIPDIQKGMFVPVDFDILFETRINKKWNLIGMYDLSSRLYLDEELRNADLHYQLLKFGAEYKTVSTKNHNGTFYTGVFISDREQKYYDRDTGKNESGELDDDSNRDSYSATGIELGYRYQHKTRLDFAVKLQMEDDDYKANPLGSEYDRSYNRIDIDYKHHLGQYANFGINYAYYVQDYDERLSRSLSGSLTVSNPLLQYSFLDVGIFLEHYVSESFRLKYGYGIKDRQDEYLGYNDYDLTRWSLTAHFKVTDSLSITSQAISWSQEHPNAWNFNRDPSLYPAIIDQEHRSVDSTQLDIKLAYRLQKNTSLFMNFDYRDDVDTDPRYGYERLIVMTGIKWAFK